MSIPGSKKDKKRKEKQKKTNKPLAVGKILIVCEGEKTEPYYFEWWKEQIEYIKKASNKSRTVGQIDVRFDSGIDVKGEGKVTESLVEKTKYYKDRAIVDYAQIWCVFDCDPDGTSTKREQYNAAIEKCKKYGINAAYTNEAFELWYLLHFNRIDTGLSRTQYEEKLTNRLGKEYKKNDPEMYELLLKHPKADQQRAIENAKTLLEKYEGTKNYADHNPSTTVHELVETLNNHLWRFRCQVAPAYPLPYPHDCEKECADSKKQPPSYPCKEIAS